ncbi:hypothetical protein R1sor_004141 [Riccia sorocarpa]|uniref:Amino acid transporter transmembrane domain-containing protein n=1 Tax=Riccia sorocarpa TaxID=122646 RepID=A0ABD3H9Q8_9MARC
MDMSSGGEGNYVSRGDPFRVVTVREVSFARNMRSELSSRSDEPELISIPVTPPGSTPPSQASPRIFSPGILTPGGYHAPRSLVPLTVIKPLSSLPSSKPLSSIPSSLPTPSIHTPKTPWTPHLRSPESLIVVTTPMRRAFQKTRQYLEDIGHFTTLNPRDAWLPVTESRNGNIFYAAFHTFNASVGFQALFLPSAFMYLGWIWGSVALAVAFFWQIYSTHLLIMMHESIPGKRLNRYIEIAQEAFGQRRGLFLVVPPLMQLSAGYCVALTILGGSALELFYSTVCTDCYYIDVLTVTEWFLVFTCLCWVVSLLPNLNSVSYVSLVGSVMALAYCTLLWAISVGAGRPLPVSYDIVQRKSDLATTLTIFTALGNVFFAFRGQNLIPEIQATMPSSLKHPAHVPMWRGARIAFVSVACCLFPIALVGYWAYGDKMLPSGILFAVYHYHVTEGSRVLIALTILMVALHAVSTYQIFAMQQFDFFEMMHSMRCNRPVPWWLKVVFRSIFVFFNFFLAVAMPFLHSVAGFLGGISSIPISFVFPCFMWLWIKKPTVRSFEWFLNWTLGTLGVCLSVCISISGIWSIIDTGLRLNFFHPGTT